MAAGVRVLQLDASAAEPEHIARAIVEAITELSMGNRS